MRFRQSERSSDGHVSGQRWKAGGKADQARLKRRAELRSQVLSRLKKVVDREVTEAGSKYSRWSSDSRRGSELTRLPTEPRRTLRLLLECFLRTRLLPNVKDEPRGQRARCVRDYDSE